MYKPPKELLELAKCIGEKTPFWVQGAGGNISYSDTEQDQFWIKASGTRLDQIEQSKSVALMKYSTSAEMLIKLKHESTVMSDSQIEKQYADTLTLQAIHNENLGRPSMETGFHIFADQNYVMHFHALSSLVIAHEQHRDPKGFSRWLKENFPKLNIVFIKPIRPGFRLAAEIADFADHDIFILENHGVIIQGASKKILEDWSKFEIQFLKDFGYHDLLDFSKLNLKQTIERLNFNLEGELKLYFPDSAVFLNELIQFLSKSQSKTQTQIFTISKEKIINILSSNETKSLNLLEIWVATVILQRIAPELSELPNHIASEVSGLPTEQYRKALNK